MSAAWSRKKAAYARLTAPPAIRPIRALMVWANERSGSSLHKRSATHSPSMTGSVDRRRAIQLALPAGASNSGNAKNIGVIRIEINKNIKLTNEIFSISTHLAKCLPRRGNDHIPDCSQVLVDDVGRTGDRHV